MYTAMYQMGYLYNTVHSKSLEEDKTVVLGRFTFHEKSRSLRVTPYMFVFIYRTYVSILKRVKHHPRPNVPFTLTVGHKLRHQNMSRFEENNDMYMNHVLTCIHYSTLTFLHGTPPPPTIVRQHR